MNDRGQYGSSFARGQYGAAFGRALYGHAAPTYGSGGYARIDHTQHWGLPAAAGNGRGQYGAPAVGAAGLGGTGFGIAPITELNEIDDAVKALNAVLEAQVLKLAGVSTSPPANSGSASSGLAHATAMSAVATHAAVVRPNDPRVAFYSSQWIPWKAKWDAFYADQSSFLTQAKDLIALPLMARSRYFDMQPYRASLIEMHQKARALGFQVPADPAPPNEPSTPSLGDIEKYVKYGAIALAAVLGVVVISNVATATRGH